MNSPKSTLTESTTECRKLGIVTKKVTEKDIEKWEVAQLIGDIVPCSRPLTFLRELEERRKLQHGKVLRQVTIDLKAINSKLEKNVKLSSDELKAHMKYFNEKFQEILYSFDAVEPTAVENSDFIKAQEKARKYKCEQQILVDELYNDLIKLENERSDENKKLLHITSEELGKIGYLLPYEIQTFVEQEVLALNQLTLNNRRNYEDLRLTLTLITEQSFKSFLEKLGCIKTEVSERKLKAALCSMGSDKKMARKKYNAMSVFDLRKNELKGSPTSDIRYSFNTAEEWMQNVQETVVAIEVTEFTKITESHGKDLIELHKKMVSAIYENFDEKAQDIGNRLRELQPLNMYELNIQGIPLDSEKELEELEIYWQDNLFEIRQQLEQVNQFLVDTEKLLNRHTERVCETQKLIIMALNKSDESNQALLQDLEVKYNIALDVLRQEHNKNELEKRYDAVIAILNSIKSEYESIFLNEVSIVEDFYKMMKLEADVLSAEFKEFIYEIHSMDPTKILHCSNDSNRMTVPQGKHITKMIAGCAQRIKALNQWQFGVWSAINALSNQTRGILKPQAEKWVQEKVEVLADKKTLQLELISKRSDRIRTEIFDQRLTELENHEKLLRNHKKEIEGTFSQIKTNLNILTEKQLEQLNQVENNWNLTQDKILEEDRPGIIFGKMSMVKKLKEEFEEGNKLSFEKFVADSASKIYDLKQSNINFMESLKLFHEGGDYSFEEGKIYASALEGIDRELEMEFKNLEKESSKKQIEIEKKSVGVFTLPITMLSSLYDETLFKFQNSEKIQFLEAELQDLAEGLRSNVVTLNKEIFVLFDFVCNRKNPLNDDIYYLLNSEIKHIYTIVSGLFFPLEYNETGQCIKGEVEGEFFEEYFLGTAYGSAKPNLKQMSFRKAKEDGHFMSKDFKSELFGSITPPEKDCTFMGTVQNRLWTVMDSFQKIACAFYKKLENRKILRTDLVPPTYEALMKDILARFKSYYNQCEQFWLGMVLDFLPMLAHMKMIVNFYIERLLIEYDYNVQGALKTLQNEFAAFLDHLSYENAMELEALDGKLLTLYGHPRNQDLLSSLEEQVVRKTAALGITWDSAIKTFKKRVKCFRCKHMGDKVELMKIKSRYNNFKDTLFVNDLGESLVEVVMGYCDAGGYYPKKKMNAAVKKMSITRRESTIYENYDLKLIKKENWCSREWYLSQLKDLLEKERLKGDKPHEHPQTPEESESSYSLQMEDLSTRSDSATWKVLLTLLDFDKFSEEIFKKLTASLASVKKFFAYQENVYEENLYKWLNKWKLNVKKVQKVYCVKNEEKPVPGNESPVSEADTKSFPQPQKKISKKRMADVENNKPQSEKTSASVTSTLPRLCPETKLEQKNTTSNIPKLRSRLFIRSRKVSNEKSKPPGRVKNLPINFYKSKLRETTNLNRIKPPKNSSLIFLTPTDHHSQIPLLKGHSFSALRMSPPVTRYPSPLKRNSPKEKQNKMKTISLDDSTKKTTKNNSSRSPSPSKRDRPPYGYKKLKGRSSSPTGGSVKTAEKTKRGNATELVTSPRMISPAKKKSKVKALTSANWDSVAMAKRAPGDDTNVLILKQSSQPTLCNTERLIQPQEKISLDHLKNEVHTGDHRRLSFEKVHLCIEKKEVENLGLGERKRSYLLTYSSEDLQNDNNEISLSFLKNLSKSSIKTFSKEECSENLSEDESKSIIRTLSGHELILTPSMRQQLDKEECENVEISELLNESEEHFEEQKDVHIPQDDASEYDSEVSTDGELAKKDKSRHQSACRVASYKEMYRKNMNAFWKSREADIMNDVDYRQSVYHPAVSRRQNGEKKVEFRPKSKSIENNFEFMHKPVDTIIRSRSQNLKHYPRDKTANSSRSRSPFGTTEGKPSYTAVMKNPPIYDVKRVRTNKERFSGALLHFTLKIIRLLAIFNVWPGDNCYILTSQSLRFAR